MALIEIEEGELAQLRAAGQSKALLDEMGANPETRRDALKLIKKLRPNANIPELDAAQPILEEVGKVDKRIADLEAKLKERDELAAKKDRENSVLSWTEQGHKALRAMGYTPEGIEAIEKVMTDRGLTDYEAAAAFWERTHPKEEPMLPADYGRSMPMFGADASDDLKKALTLPRGAGQTQALNRWTKAELNAGMAEIRAGRSQQRNF